MNTPEIEIGSKVSFATERGPVMLVTDKLDDGSKMFFCKWWNEALNKFEENQFSAIELRWHGAKV